MKSAGKARSNGLYRHIRTSKEIIRNLLNYSFRDIENTADITWLYGKGLCICIGLILLLALPKIVRKRG